MSELNAVVAIAARDVTKLIRDRPRLAVNLMFPVLLIGGLGSVLQASLGVVTGVDAVAIAFSGVLAATVFQSAAAGMISIVEDRETDFARELFVAPVRRTTLLAGKITGEAAVAMAQVAFVVLFAVIFGVRVSGPQLLRLIPVAVLISLLGAAFGLATVAALPNQRSAMQVFQFLIIPQYVLAGVLVPLHALPTYLNVIAGVMPLRYAVNLARAAYFAGDPAAHAVSPADPARDALIVVALLVALLIAGALIFDYRERTR
ncbi:MAG TPA: ABC transporter permease [Micromonosporaceae bacterium]|jgi:ABC-2 type transport system permease protein